MLNSSQEVSTGWMFKVAYVHTGEETFKCEICLKMFKDLKSHIKMHAKEKSFKCEICLKMFHVRGSLKYHMLTHTGQKPNIIKCSP